ncbi:MAG: molecular chaperone HtpG [Kiritimatiellaeota bacterium]|nr:molecular chaperone HtpG [Kiritimatiellota bacterium]
MEKTFQTEVSQLLDLVIHSLYSKKEVFLRELISNASDAIDRARFEAVAGGTAAEEAPFEIRIIPDKDAKTLTISDNGIGMSAEETEQNIGTIASSGTKRFLQAMKEKKDAPELIGQFGVGFYASFMVAEKVEMTTRKRGGAAVKWVSEGKGNYDISTEDSDVSAGTTIILHLRDDQQEFLSPWRIREIVEKYSDYIAYPVVLEEKDEAGQETRTTLNSMKAIWKRGKDEVTKEELDDFYKHIAHDTDEPLATIQFSAEGTTEFRALLFIPRAAPYDLFYPNARQGLQLYARNVFIGDDIKELLPRHLSFVRGVVESSDLPLNVSREMLQDDAIIRRIRKSLVSKIISAVEDMKAKQPDDFALFNGEFGRMLKEGVHSDWENKDKLKDLILFCSTFSEDETKPVTLKDYVSRMPSSQNEIYYISADSFAAAKNSPILEAFVLRGFEVLFFTEPIDEFAAETLREYDGKKIRAADKGEIDLGDAPVTELKNGGKDAAATKKADSEKFKALTDFLAERFKDKVKSVRLSTRLTDSASCLVADEHGYSAHMERVMKAFNREAPKSLRVLEINGTHPAVGKMLGLAEGDADSSVLADYADLLFGQAQLAEGSPLDNPARFNKLIAGLM